MYLGSNSGAGRLRIFLNACAFVAGFTLVFTFFGVGVGVLGATLAPYLINIRFVSFIILILLGLSMLEIFNFSPPWANKMLQVPSRIKAPMLVSFIVGVIFAFAWSPCVGLILGYILTIAFTVDDW